MIIIITFPLNSSAQRGQKLVPIQISVTNETSLNLETTEGQGFHFQATMETTEYVSNRVCYYGKNNLRIL